MAIGLKLLRIMQELNAIYYFFKRLILGEERLGQLNSNLWKITNIRRDRQKYNWDLIISMYIGASNLSLAKELKSKTIQI